MATTEVGIDFLQEQVDNCDSIVANIDKIVPKLYKIRQQALAQKEYINDVNKIILTNIDHTSGITSAKSVTLTNSVLFSSDTTISNAITANGVDSRKIIQSLFKFKHDIGTTTHFTTEQKGSANERKQGFNLSDVVQITDGLDNLLALDSETGVTITNANVSKLFQKQLSGVNTSVDPIAGTPLIAATRGENSYKYTGTNNGGVESGFTATLTATDTILGFGLT